MLKRLAIATLLVLTALLRPSFGAAKIPPDHADYARALLARGALDSAMAVVDSSLAADSANPEMWMIKAVICAGRAERGEEIHTLRTLLGRYPLYPDALIALARAYLDSGLADSAARYLPPHLFRPGPNQIEALCLKGRILESQGHPDSAIASYGRAHDILDRRVLLRLPPLRQQRLGQARLLSAGGVPSVWRVGFPTIFLFWANWSPESVAAFGDIVQNLKGSGITWRFVPVNVDTLHPDHGIVTDAVNRAQALGYKDTVWVDTDLTVFRNWSIESVPTVIVANINGDIDAVISGWTDESRAAIVDRYLGSYTDSVSADAPTTPAARTRSGYMIATAQAAGLTGNLEQAVLRADKAVSADPTFPLANVTLAIWRWQRGDTLGARQAAVNALRADSTDQWAMTAVARIAYLSGHYQSALDLARRCLAQDSAFVPAWRVLGQCAVALRDTITANQAIEAIARFNKLDLELPVLMARSKALIEPAWAAALFRQAMAGRP